MPISFRIPDVKAQYDGGDDSKKQAIVEALAIAWFLLCFIHACTYGSGSGNWGLANSIIGMLLIAPLAFFGASNKHPLLIACAVILDAIFIICHIGALIEVASALARVNAAIATYGCLPASTPQTIYCAIFTVALRAANGMVACETIYMVLAIAVLGPMAFFAHKVSPVSAESFSMKGGPAPGSEPGGVSDASATPQQPHHDAEKQDIGASSSAASASGSAWNEDQAIPAPAYDPQLSPYVVSDPVAAYEYGSETKV